MIETHKTNLEKKRSSQIFKPSKNHRQSDYAINPRRRQLWDYQEFWIGGVSCPTSKDQGTRFDSQTKESLELKFDALTDAINAQTIELKAQSSALDKLKTQSAAYQIEMKAQSAAYMIELKAQGTARAAAEAKVEKRQRLEWGIANPGFDAFDYYVGTCSFDSSKLVRLILLAFRHDKGFELDIGRSPSIQCVQIPTGNDCKSFRDRLGEQVEALVGVKPRFEQDAEGEYWIYYE
jgi:hypothetical protein